MGGASDMNSVLSRAPITTNARNRAMSPMKNPSNPESERYSQRSRDASVGKGRPRSYQHQMMRNAKAMTSRTRLTTSDPTRRDADSNASALSVQQNAVPTEKSVPSCQAVMRCAGAYGARGGASIVAPHQVTVVALCAHGWYSTVSSLPARLEYQPFIERGRAPAHDVSPESKFASHRIRSIPMFVRTLV